MAPYYIAVPLFLNTLFSLSLARIVLRSRAVPGRLAFLGMLLAAAIWSTGYAMELLTPDLTGKLLWAKFQYLSIASLPLFWFDFSIKYAAFPRGGNLHRYYLGPLATLAVFTLLLAWSNDSHGLLWQQVKMPEPGQFPSLVLSHGIWFWIHTVISYTLIASGNLILLAALVRNRSRLLGWQIALALLAGLLPWLANLYYHIDMGPLNAIDLTPFSFSLAGFIIYISIFQFRLLAVAPFGHEIIFRGLADPAIILDHQQQVIELNPAAMRLFGLQMEAAIGKPVAQVLPAEAVLALEKITPVEITLPNGSISRYFKLRVDPLVQTMGIPAGWLVLLQDITQQKMEQQELEAAIAERTEALREANDRLSGELVSRRNLESRYRGLFDGAPIMYVTTRAQEGQPVIAEANQLFLETLGYQRADVIEQPLAHFYTPESRQAMLSGGYREALENKLHIVERQLLTRQGTVIWAILRAISDTDETGRVIGTRAMYVDISERKRAEQALERMVNQRHRLLDLSVGMLSTLEMDQALDRILGTVEELLALDIGMLLWVDEEARLLRPQRMIGKEALLEKIRNFSFPLDQGGMMNHVLQSGQPELINNAHLDPRVVHPEGRRAPYEHVIVVPVQWSEQRLGVLCLVRVTDHPFTQDDFELAQLFMALASIAIQNARLYSAVEEQVREIRQKENQLRAVTAQMQAIQEIERRNLAAELHDRVGQNLTALTLNNGMMQSLVPDGADKQLRGRLEDSLALLQDTTQLVRDVMAELRPPALDDFGLSSALRTYSQTIQNRTGLQIQVLGPESEVRLPAAQETALFRITQEALHNIVKHAQATQVTIRLAAYEEGLELTVQDNGQGFEPGRLDSNGEQAHWGLLTMQERAQAAGGSAEIFSSPGQGTCVRVRIKKFAARPA